MGIRKVCPYLRRIGHHSYLKKYKLLELTVEPTTTNDFEHLISACFNILYLGGYRTWLQTGKSAV